MIIEYKEGSSSLTLRISVSVKVGEKRLEQKMDVLPRLKWFSSNWRSIGAYSTDGHYKRSGSEEECDRDFGSNDMSKYYEVLEIDQMASDAEVKAAYRVLSKVWHPDRFQGDQLLHSRAEMKQKAINEAYSVIMKRRSGASVR